MLTQDESSNTSYLYSSGVGREEVYVITLVYRTIPIKNSVNSIQSMVATISEVEAKLGNVKVFKWALWNEYFDENDWDHNIFIDIAENGHIKILEIADRKEVLDWYSSEILIGASTRNDWELLDFLLQKKPNKFDLGFKKMCIQEGYIEVIDWWERRGTYSAFY